ncbi:MAG: hypothetical protein WAM39_31300 [Bryobacteraceae bacterium]
MQRRLISIFSCATVVLCTSALRLIAQEPAQGGATVPRLKAYSWVKPGPSQDKVDAMKNLMATDPSKTLPLWTFFVESTRDGNAYTGVMVGQDPFNGGGSVNVTTYLVPLIIKTVEIGTSVNAKTDIIATKPGNTTFNPTIADSACLTAPNNVPLTLVQQSPILNSATFDFGGTIVGTTQYVDAFQRGNFWGVNDHDTYHVLLNPVTTLGAHRDQRAQSLRPGSFDVGTRTPGLLLANGDHRHQLV